jgi:hypothetical protein
MEGGEKEKGKSASLWEWGSEIEDVKVVQPGGVMCSLVRCSGDAHDVKYVIDVQ